MDDGVLMAMKVIRISFVAERQRSCEHLYLARQRDPGRSWIKTPGLSSATHTGLELTGLETRSEDSEAMTHRLTHRLFSVPPAGSRPVPRRVAQL